MNVEFVSGAVERPEFADMFGGWLLEHGGKTFLVDSGVGAGAKNLVANLSLRLGQKPLDYVLLTHIHLDHAGGLGEITQRWPKVRVVAHEKGVPHLAEPDKLWDGTQKVMRELADMYGRPSAIPQRFFIPHTQADIAGLVIFETPGHAQHHLSFRVGDNMFVGEAGGAPHIMNGRLYTRPGTPPRYFAEAGFKSIDLLLEQNDKEAYFAHEHYLLPYRESLEMCKEQLIFWLDFLKSPDGAPRRDESRPAYLARIADRLFWEDPLMRPLNSLPQIELQREKFFIRNSVDGLLQHLEYLAKKNAA